METPCPRIFPLSVPPPRDAISEHLPDVLSSKRQESESQVGIIHHHLPRFFFSFHGVSFQNTPHHIHASKTCKACITRAPPSLDMNTYVHEPSLASVALSCAHTSHNRYGSTNTPHRYITLDPKSTSPACYSSARKARESSRGNI